MKVLYWNCYFKTPPQVVLRELKEMAATHKPHIIGLGEASYMRGITDDVPGYRRIHLPRVRRVGNEDADTAVLVRNDVQLRYKRVWRMGMKWYVPRKRVLHDPRVYIVVRVKVEGKRWRIAIGHWPFGAAQEETKRKVKRWFTWSTLPSAFVGDLNAREPEITQYFKPLRNIGFGIDRAIYKKCRVTARNLGKHGSDHPAVLFNFR